MKRTYNMKSAKNHFVTPLPRRIALIVAAVFFVFSALPTSVLATTATKPWSATEMLRSHQTMKLQPGESATFTIAFKNSGTQTWRQDGMRFVSVYTYGPKYRKSVFQDSTWPNEKQPARLIEAEVKPGSLGRFSFVLFAPLDEGSYKETFILAAEDTAWLDTSQFTLNIEVAKSGATINPSLLSRPPAYGYKATKLLVSDQKLTLDAGTTKEFRVGIKNIGRVAWQPSGASPVRIMAEAQSNAYSFRNTSWQGDVAAAISSAIQPGSLAFFTVKLAAPNSAGAYLAKFSLTAGDSAIEGGDIELPIEVTGGYVAPSVPIVTADALFDPDLSVSGSRGPNIRIGLFYTTEPVKLAAAGAYNLIDGNDQLVRQLSGVTTVTFDFNSLTYYLRNGEWNWTTDRHVHFVPVDPAATIFEIQSLENRPTWDPSINFNKYRGTLEVFYTRATSRLWVMEELPIEDYMRGLAETSNGSPYEYQKALVTAARTYALFVKAIGGKYKSQYFDMTPTAGDQVYKGYTSELVRPNVVRAVEETRGMAVTYNNEIVVTPYFSRSDGRTRSWTEVWGSTPHPWLVSQPAPYDQGKTLWGHGVGLSASDAVGRAEAGATWQDILKYYYTGVEIKRLY